ncbi:MAG TPA: HAMP domain-containing sensor histidine kinase [Bacillota bacterium]|nr:HAMP domain-containing sensor histidine kinase [Bacillota bacterium]
MRENFDRTLDNLLNKMSIRMRLTLWYSSLLGLTMLVFGIFLFVFLSHNLRSEVDQAITNLSDQVVRSVTVVGDLPLPLIQVVLPDVDVFATPDTYLQVVRENGEIIARSGNLGHQTLPLSEETLLYSVKGKGFFETISSGKQTLRIYNLPLTYNNKIIGLLQVGRALAPVERALSRLSLVLLFSAIGLVILAGMTGWVLAGVALKPIGYLTRATEEIKEARDLQRQIPYRGPEDEIGELTDTINDMFARLHHAYTSLEESVAAQKRFVANASHELRTPLTVISGNVELLRRMDELDEATRKEVLEDIVADTGRLTRLVNDLLSLARADAGYEMPLEVLNLQEIVAEIERQAPLLRGNVEFTGLPRETQGPVRVIGNADYLQQLLLIILDNALKYTPAGGRVWLTLEDRPGLVGLAVHDTGQGIIQEDLARIFQPFFRADKARVGRGTGLGLSIAQWIVEKHGGTIEAVSTIGEGSTFTIWLPEKA